MNTSDYKLDFIRNFMPSLSNFPPEILDNLSKKMQKTLTLHDKINGIFLISTANDQPLVYSKSLSDFEIIKDIADLINSFNLSNFINSLGSKRYHGNEVMEFPEFAIGFVKLTKNEILAVLITTKNEIGDPNMIKTIVKEVKNEVIDKAITSKLKNMPKPNSRNKLDNELDTSKDNDLDPSIPRPGR